MHHDDYAVLGASLDDLKILIERPVSTNLAYLMGYMGPDFSYALLNLLAGVVPGLALAFVLQLFRAETSVAAGVVMGVVVFGHFSAIEHERYLAVITNLTSHVLGSTSMLFLLSGWRRRAPASIYVAVTLYALSAFAKEDFLLPPLLLVGFLALQEKHGSGESSDSGQRRSALRLMGILAAIAFASVAYNLLLRSPFLSGVGGAGRVPADPYALTLSPSALLDNFERLTLGYAYWQCVAWAVSLVVLVLLWPDRIFEATLLGLMTIVIVLPYVPIGNNAPGYRAFAWLPWLTTPMVLLASMGWSERLRLLPVRHAGKILVPLVLAASFTVFQLDATERIKVADWYRRVQAANASMVKFIIAWKPAIDHDGIVGVVGVEGLSPWSKTKGTYLQRNLGFSNEWVVFVDKPTVFFPLGPGMPGSKISVRSLDAVCQSPNMLIIDFDSTGKGAVVRGKQICERLGGRT